MTFLPKRKLLMFLLVFLVFLCLYTLYLENILCHERGQAIAHDPSRVFIIVKCHYFAYVRLLVNQKPSQRNVAEYNLTNNGRENQDANPTGAEGCVNSTSLPDVEPEPPTTAGRPIKATKITEADFIEDQYVAENLPSQTRCPSGIRRRVSQTAFAKRYLDSVPVLQWAKHFSPQEYQRLAHYSGAYGWGSVDIEVVKESLAVLNTSAHREMFDDWEMKKNRSQCIRCAVVGNGGILRGSRKGKEIDQHDYVFRTNGAVLKGFKEDVGKRTSHYTFSTNTLRNSMVNYAHVGYVGPPLSKVNSLVRGLLMAWNLIIKWIKKNKETKYLFLPDHDRDYILMKAAAMHTPVDRGPERSNKPPDYFGDDVTSEKFKMFHPDFIRYLRNRFLRSYILSTKFKDIYRPSTGAIMLLAALHTCDQVSAYGFMTPDYDKYSDHYYDRTNSTVQFYVNHDLRLELSLWQQLHQAGLIELYMRL
ncbi:alpha-N-acetylgalactosaminide alpha-2,6-sialyltransferase 2 isoform X1 [Electrophorus electricus]|uniref:alpha-N-acetylgalactosaminide alpha-2,6-sialyltransferase 2 isoform X1 n=1 Tax=Electrophorus electricus TaxID=8005 RepID=UPI0015CF9006|nr:alpha-N-acetylgalactosaminide alpha-2,6-sialyltransferase 2 isoform X1 [Electrophorus electricus]